MNRCANVKTWLWALAACLAVALVIWKGPERHFPYTGTWVHHQDRDGLVLVIDKNGRWSFSTLRADVQSSTSFDHMEGDSAIVRFVVKGRSSALSCIMRVTPLDSGRTLHEEILKGIETNSKTGESHNLPSPEDLYLTKEKD